MTPDAQRLFAALDATWPPARLVIDGPWTLRDGRGGGKRVSAATANIPVSETDIASAEAGMIALGQQPLFMIRQQDTDLDGWLDARRYTVVDPVVMYLSPVSALADPQPMTAIVPTWPMLAIQRDLWQMAGIGPGRIAVMERASGPRCALLARHKDTPAGVAFLAADGDIAMIHALEVVPSERRSGVARRAMKAAAQWAADNGAEWLALAVTRANEGANALYRGLGMTPAATYHYRLAPEVAP